ncbi:BgTH12-06355 [Blumeria graminis f. sp. triticale]|uniref:RBR-type E3 ubiquitin transferase n=1 Tax=Blumeria graminis f. sp. triticale TaxID=1689686 RepID=A0A9W4GDE6_BLUGR|nr:BgTH12-06355 [Blumeria graminis f. sp. triticale]
MDPYSSMDDATAALIIQLQIQETQELLDAEDDKGKGRENDKSDVKIALQSYLQDLEANHALVTDRVLTKRIGEGLEIDGDEATADPYAETLANDDGECHSENGEFQPSNPFVAGAHPSSLDSSGLNNYEFSFNYPRLDSSSKTGACSSTSKSRAESSRRIIPLKSSEVPRNNCTACQNLLPSNILVRCPCSHDYCEDCLSDLFRASITDESLFPPRCCKQPIVLNSRVSEILSSELVDRFEEKKIEIETPDRTYCSNQLCSAFIRMEFIAEEKAECKKCGTTTCIICKGASHIGDCPSDKSLNLLLELAEERGWQRCYNCRRVVELEIGCNHMTCPCGSEFCYVCAERWKTCGCEQWDEERLLARTNAIVARQPVAFEDDLFVLDHAADVMQNLRLRHDCDHEQWRWVRGHHRCELCYHTLPSYIFECRECAIQICNRCRRNRI